MSASRREFLQRGMAVGALAALALRDDGLDRVLAASQSAGERSAEDLACDEDFWTQIQQAFTADRSVINLNNGGVSPSPRVVQEAMRRHLEHANQAPARTMWQELDPHVETVRERLARTFGCAPGEMAITRNASESLQICIYGIDLKPGDEVLTTLLDYPRMITTWKQREQREGIVLRQIPLPVPLQDSADAVAAFAAAITPQTKVILCSHVVFLTGQILPVREICRLGQARGIPVIVDGAHAFAHMAFRRADLECEYYGTSLHKWTTAPHGTGFLYVKQERIPALWPLMAAPEPRSDNIRKFEEIGTHPAANRLAIAEALTLYDAIGPRRKEARLRALRNRWVNALAGDKRVSFATRLEPEHGCGFVTMAIQGLEPLRLVEYLWARHRIIVVAIDHELVKGIRVSPNVYTTTEEIDLFVDALKNVLANGLPVA